ncbi:hypothetical protein [Paucilactobacillus wasatchensis]|uniref:Uncharacterized protein n=1 Tax=Paucilactobacillus wasatchensis TaxID=1335616 RepID=A0A0D1A545_9LACO|nr:hypothetical protein [Paucilactobacillus wasatchensis]KIS02995.1 hypothetical protein WDC_1419 [Paucilactobacillus wasatchensis]
MRNLQLIVGILLSFIIFAGLIWITLIKLVSGLMLFFCWLIGSIIVMNLVSYLVIKLHTNHHEKKE